MPKWARGAYRGRRISDRRDVRSLASTTAPETLKSPGTISSRGFCRESGYSVLLVEEMIRHNWSSALFLMSEFGAEKRIYRGQEMVPGGTPRDKGILGRREVCLPVAQGRGYLGGFRVRHTAKANRESEVKTGELECDATEARRYHRWRPWIRTGVLLSLVVLVGFTVRQITRQAPPVPTNTLTVISPSDYADSNLPRTVHMRNVTFILERACRGYSDHKTGPTNTRPFAVAKMPWAVGYQAKRRSREPSPWMFAAGVIGGEGEQRQRQRQPILAFYDPGREETSAGNPGTKGVVVVDGICGNCLISVYAINCDWEIGVYTCEAGKDAPESGGAVVRLLGQGGLASIKL